MKCHSGSSYPKNLPPKTDRTPVRLHAHLCLSCYRSLRFLVLSTETLRRGGAIAPAYVSSVQASEGMQKYTSVQYRGTTVGAVARNQNGKCQRGDKVPSV